MARTWPVMVVIETVTVMKITDASGFSDSRLLTELARLAGAERETTAAFIVHLAEFDGRRLYAGAGYTSTFRYCVEELHLSEDATCNRIEAARAARAFPVVLDMLVVGTLSLTTARILRQYLTAENHRDLLAAAAGKSRQQVEKMLAQRFPKADVASSVRRLPATPAAPAPAMPPEASPFPAVPAPIQALSARPVPRPLMRPLSATRYEIRFTATEEIHATLREAQDLLGHAVPSGDLAHVFGRALTLLVEDLRKRKAGAGVRPRSSPGQAEGSRNIPAAVRRQVWDRDKAACSFVASSGRRCGETRRLEFHHDRLPYAAGGKPTVDNIALRCRAHNRYESERFYGPGRAHGGTGALHPSQDG